MKCFSLRNKKYYFQSNGYLCGIVSERCMACTFTHQWKKAYTRYIHKIIHIPMFKQLTIISTCVFHFLTHTEKISNKELITIINFWFKVIDSCQCTYTSIYIILLKKLWYCCSKFALVLKNVCFERSK